MGSWELCFVLCMMEATQNRDMVLRHLGRQELAGGTLLCDRKVSFALAPYLLSRPSTTESHISYSRESN